MPFLPAHHSRREPALNHPHLLALALILVWPCAALGQGSGRSTVGTNGSHIIAGYVFFPSGRRAEGTIQVKLQSLNYAELFFFFKQKTAYDIEAPRLDRGAG